MNASHAELGSRAVQTAEIALEALAQITDLVSDKDNVSVDKIRAVLEQAAAALNAAERSHDAGRLYPNGPLECAQHPPGYVCWKCGAGPKAVLLAALPAQAPWQPLERDPAPTDTEVRLLALEQRLVHLERPIHDRDAIAWEIGRSAGIRGDADSLNPFRKASR